MFVARCHCGNVSLEANEPPETVTSCNCSICYRIGATWAYYTKEQVAINGINKTKVYLWGQKIALIMLARFVIVLLTIRNCEMTVVIELQ